jgi:hypothetical protein
MVWAVEFHEDFVPEFDALPQAVQTELAAKATLRLTVWFHA